MGIEIELIEIAKASQYVVDLLRKNNLHTAFAESCTGGMISAAIVGIAGSSSVLDMSIVTYANSAKIEYTDVTQEVLDQHGAVSSQTAVLMAEGIRKRANADIGVGITGIAGPDGGTAEKPVGTVYVAIASGKNTQFRHLLLQNKNRNGVRTETTLQTLKMLGEHINDFCL